MPQQIQSTAERISSPASPPPTRLTLTLHKTLPFFPFLYTFATCHRPPAYLEAAEYTLASTIWAQHCASDHLIARTSIISSTTDPDPNCRIPSAFYPRANAALIYARLRASALKPSNNGRLLSDNFLAALHPRYSTSPFCSPRFFRPELELSRAQSLCS